MVDNYTSIKTTTSIIDDTTGARHAAAGTTPLGALAGHFTMGFEVVAVMKTERGAGPLAGTWEVWLKRKIHGRPGENHATGRKGQAWRARACGAAVRAGGRDAGHR